MNGQARLRFELILYNHHHTPAFQWRVVTISAPGPYTSHQDRVFLDWFRNFTASQPFQSPIISIINGQRRLGLGCGLKCDHHNLFWVVVGIKVGLARIPLFTQRLSDFGPIQAVHSISSFPMSHYKYNKWLEKVEIWIHHVLPSPHPSFWVTGGESFGTRPLRFTPTLSVCRLIQQFHSISTFLISLH